MLERVLEFSEREVKDVMVTRIEVTAIESAPLSIRFSVVEARRYHGFRFITLLAVASLHGKDLMPTSLPRLRFRLKHGTGFIPDTHGLQCDPPLQKPTIWESSSMNMVELRAIVTLKID